MANLTPSDIEEGMEIWAKCTIADTRRNRDDEGYSPGLNNGSLVGSATGIYIWKKYSVIRSHHDCFEIRLSDHYTWIIYYNNFTLSHLSDYFSLTNPEESLDPLKKADPYHRFIQIAKES